MKPKKQETKVVRVNVRTKFKGSLVNKKPEVK